MLSLMHITYLVVIGGGFIVLSVRKIKLHYANKDLEKMLATEHLRLIELANKLNVSLPAMNTHARWWR